MRMQRAYQPESIWNCDVTASKVLDIKYFFSRKES